MKLITRNTDYAIRAVTFIAKNKERVVTADELVKTFGIPRSFLRKTLQALSKNGIISSQKGVGGGFRLKRPANKILITDLMEIFQGPVNLNECFFKKVLCANRKVCPLKKKIDKIGRHVASELGKISIADLL